MNSKQLTFLEIVLLFFYCSATWKELKWTPWKLVKTLNFLILIKTIIIMQSYLNPLWDPRKNATLIPYGTF